MKQTSFLQTDIWASFKESQGWHGHRVDDILILERPLPLGMSFLYSPEVVGGPDQLLALLPQVHAIALRRKSLFYRLELLIDSADVSAEHWRAALTYTQFQKGFEDVQPSSRQIVPLTTEEKVLANMKSKGRYNIRLAEKAPVFVREATPKTLADDVAIFYGLFQVTAKRDKFSLRPPGYFRDLCQLLYHHQAGKLFLATFNGEPVAAAIITLHEGVASYLYGASGNNHREKMGPYALHWAAMQWAMSQDAIAYDLLAIRPPDASGKSKSHAYDGITRFKQQFGGDSVHLLGSWDLPLNRNGYTLFSVAEKLRR